MTPTSLHAQNFWRQLDTHQRDWLFERAHKSEQSAPTDWVAWYGDSRFLGWVSQARAEQMVVLLPGCTLSAFITVPAPVWMPQASGPSSSRLALGSTLTTFASWQIA